MTGGIKALRIATIAALCVIVALQLVENDMTSIMDCVLSRGTSDLTLVCLTQQKQNAPPTIICKAVPIVGVESTSARRAGGMMKAPGGGYG
jgi:hypothetical protein